MMENVTLVVSMDTIRSNAEINVTAYLVADGQTKVNQCEMFVVKTSLDLIIH